MKTRLFRSIQETVNLYPIPLPIDYEETIKFPMVNIQYD